MRDSDKIENHDKIFSFFYVTESVYEARDILFASDKPMKYMVFDESETSDGKNLYVIGDSFFNTHWEMTDTLRTLGYIKDDIPVPSRYYYINEEKWKEIKDSEPEPELLRMIYVLVKGYCMVEEGEFSNRLNDLMCQGVIEHPSQKSKNDSMSGDLFWTHSVQEMCRHLHDSAAQTRGIYLPSEVSSEDRETWCSAAAFRFIHTQIAEMANREYLFKPEKYNEHRYNIWKQFYLFVWTPVKSRDFREYASQVGSSRGAAFKNGFFTFGPHDGDEEWQNTLINAYSEMYGEPLEIGILTQGTMKRCYNL